MEGGRRISIHWITNRWTIGALPCATCWLFSRSTTSTSPTSFHVRRNCQINKHTRNCGAIFSFWNLKVMRKMMRWSKYFLICKTTAPTSSGAEASLINWEKFKLWTVLKVLKVVAVRADSLPTNKILNFLISSSTLVFSVDYLIPFSHPFSSLATISAK